MIADPKPVESVPLPDSQRSICLRHPNAPQRSDGLEVQGRVQRIFLEELELLVRGCLDSGRQLTVQFLVLCRRIRLKLHNLAPAFPLAHGPKLLPLDLIPNLFYNP